MKLLKLWNTLITECITLHATTLVHPLIFLGSLAIIFDTFLADICLSFVIWNNMLIFFTFLEDSALCLDDLNHYLKPYNCGLAYRHTAQADMYLGTACFLENAFAILTTFLREFENK